MKVTLIGCGCGSLTREAADAISRAGMLVGSGRLLRQYAGEKPCAEAVTAEAILNGIGKADCEEVGVLFSGDSGFFSGVRLLLPLLDETRFEVRVLPGITSVQTLSAKLKRPWQNWGLYSAHGVACDAVGAVCEGKPAFFLTGGKTGPADLCRQLNEAGLGFLEVTVGENLGTEGETITHGTAEEFAEHSFSALCVMLAEAAPCPRRRVPGLKDSEFIRAEKIPMTKQEVRAAALAKLGVGPDDICWDIGAGTGSVSVELALQAKAVYAVEPRCDALCLAAENRKKHAAWKLRLIEGTAPEALEGLPVPDAVFVGGSGGRLREILHAVHRANVGSRVCVSAVSLENLQEATETLRELGFRPEVCQISVSRGKEAGDLTLMLAHNPVWLICGS